jgi:hypothetical protein
MMIGGLHLSMGMNRERKPGTMPEYDGKLSQLCKGAQPEGCPTFARDTSLKGQIHG